MNVANLEQLRNRMDQLDEIPKLRKDLLKLCAASKIEQTQSVNTSTVRKVAPRMNLSSREENHTTQQPKFSEDIVSIESENRIHSPLGALKQKPIKPCIRM